jgi:hypothetical protein
VVFTDGSMDIEVVVPSWNIKNNFSVTAGVSILTAELVAILKALEIINQRPH